MACEPRPSRGLSALQKLSKQATFSGLNLVAPQVPVAEDDEWRAHLVRSRQWSQRRIAAYIASPHSCTREELEIIASGEALLSAAAGAGAMKEFRQPWTVETAHIRSERDGVRTPPSTFVLPHISSVQINEGSRFTLRVCSLGLMLRRALPSGSRGWRCVGHRRWR